MRQIKESHGNKVSELDVWPTLAGMSIYVTRKEGENPKHVADEPSEGT